MSISTRPPLLFYTSPRSTASPFNSSGRRKFYSEAITRYSPRPGILKSWKRRISPMQNANRSAASTPPASLSYRRRPNPGRQETSACRESSLAASEEKASARFSPVSLAKEGLKGVCYRTYDLSMCTYCSAVNGIMSVVLPLIWYSDG